jgi:hypothetical protein
LDGFGLVWTYPIQVALPKKSSMKAMMTKMPQPVMLACALGGVLVGERLRAGLHHGEVVLARAEVGLSQRLVVSALGVVSTVGDDDPMSI